MKVTLNIGGDICAFEHPMVMGILNATSDSFYISCDTLDEREIIACAQRALSEGANILDIGGCSTRPDGEIISAAVEWERVEKALRSIRETFPEAILSIDTFRSEIAQRAVTDYGVQLINDISGGERDEKMFETVAALQVPYILTHSKPLGETITDIEMMREIIGFFEQKVDTLHTMGVRDVILDPGFGFGKTLSQNYALLRCLPDLQTLNLPILVGISHKSMIYKALGITTQEAGNGTTVLHTLALQKGANILRVHEVKEAVETIKLYELTNTN